MPTPLPPRLLGLAAALALTAGCREAAPAAPAPSPAAAAAPSAPPAAPAPILKDASALEPAGTVQLSPTAEVVVDPGATFRIELSRSCADARLLLVDARDALVEASGTQEVGAVTRLTLAPSAPLTPAARYVLRVDGAASREFHDDAGGAHAPVAFAILVAGEPPPPPPKAEPKRRKRR